MFPLALWMAMVPPPESPLPAILPRPASWSDASLSIEPRIEVSPTYDIEPRLRVHNEAAAILAVDPLASLRRDGDKRQSKTDVTGDFAAVSGKLSIRDPDLVRDDPARRGQSWATDQMLRVPVSDRFFVFSAVDAESSSVEQQSLKWQGKTGLGLKLRPWLLDEVQLKGGPSLRYDDEDRPVRGAPERSELFLEVTTKLPLPVLGPVNLEYSGTAMSPSATTDRERFKQNVKFALPLSATSQFHVGAKWYTEDQPTQSPFVDRAELYLGIQLKR